MIGRIIFGIIGVAIGFSFVVYTHPIVDNTTRIGFAERYLGAAGTYVFYKIMGVIIIFVSLLVMIGVGDMIYNSVLGTLKPISGNQ
jgi:uncharacterized membrane protein YkgB